MTETIPQAGSLPDKGLVAMVPRINIGIFCEDPQTAAILEQAAGDRRMSRADTAIHMGGIAGAARHYAKEQTPNLVIVESTGSRPQIMAELSSLAEVCGADTKVIVIGHVNDIVLYRELMKNHVSDYLVVPFSPVQVIEAITSIFNDPNAAPLGRVIAFIGAKGGVGSSTIAHHIAYAISSKFDTETILTDLDLSFGTASLNFNHDAGGTFYDALSQPDRVDATLIERLMSRLGNKLSLLNGPSAVDRDLTLTPESVESVLSVVRQAAPIVIVDIPNAWSPWIQHTLMAADNIVITATPELAALRNAKNLMELLRTGRPNDRAPSLVLNQVGVPKRPEIAASEFAKALDVDPVAVIPYDPQNFGLAQGNGQMLFEVAAKAKATDALLKLAAHIMGADDAQAKTSMLDLSGLMQKIPALSVLPLRKKKAG